MSDIQPLMRVGEVAEYLDCSVRHVWNLIARGDLPVIGPGRDSTDRTERHLCAVGFFGHGERLEVLFTIVFRRVGPELST